jgi:hypothetical protein
MATSAPPETNPEPQQPLLLPLSERLEAWLEQQSDTKNVDNQTDADSFFVSFDINVDGVWHTYHLVAMGDDQPEYRS